MNTAQELTAHTVSKRYGQTLALDQITVTLRRGEIHGIAGHNGAGKSTLLRILAGAENPDTGGLRIGDRTVALSSPAAALSEGIVAVYQELSLAPNLTVAENLFLGNELNRLGRIERRSMNQTTGRLLGEFGLQIAATDRVGTLPVAQRQMVEILRGLHRNASFLLLDEPTTALQPEQIELLLATLRRVAVEQNIAIAIIDHKLDELYAVADRITALTDGRVALSAEVSRVPRQQLVNAIIGTDEDDSNAATVAHRAFAAATDDSTDRPQMSPGGAALRVEHLRTSRLTDVSLTVAPGRVLGIYGLVGSGRTRTLRTIMGLDKAISGSVSLWGRPFQPSSPAQAMRAGIAYVSEERKADGFVLGRDAFENAALPVLHRFSRFGVINRSAARRAARNTLGALDIRGNVDGPIERLSGGNQQKALLGKALLQQPRLLLLDEPTKGIDIGTKSEIHGIVRELAHGQGVAVIVVSSEEEEILALADDVVVMRNGRCDGNARPVADFDVTTLRRIALGSDRVA